MIRVALSWALYWIGLAVAEVIVIRTIGHFYEWPFRLGNKLFAWSNDLQGDDPRGPWWRQ